jgi:hypothetical protein
VDGPTVKPLGPVTHGCSRISFRRGAARTEVDMAPRPGNALSHDLIVGL